LRWSRYVCNEKPEYPSPVFIIYLLTGSRDMTTKPLGWHSRVCCALSALPASSIAWTG